MIMLIFYWWLIFVWISLIITIFALRIGALGIVFCYTHIAHSKFQFLAFI